MLIVLKKIWPALLGIILFIGVSSIVRQHLDVFRTLLSGSTYTHGILLYLLLGVITVVVPFGSILPFIPLAVALWGWLLTAVLTLTAWVVGGQILFEIARLLGKPAMEKIIPPGQFEMLSKLVKDRGLLHGIMVRMFFHGDVVSYGFGIFTNISRWEFCIVTLVGVAPGAFFYAYFGSLPLRYQVAAAIGGLAVLTGYYILDWKKPEFLRRLGFRTPA